MKRSRDIFAVKPAARMRRYFDCVLGAAFPSHNPVNSFGIAQNKPAFFVS